MNDKWTFAGLDDFSPGLGKRIERLFFSSEYRDCRDIEKEIIDILIPYNEYGINISSIIVTFPEGGVTLEEELECWERYLQSK